MDQTSSISLLDKKAAALNNYFLKLDGVERAKVLSVGDGVAWLKGLPSAAMDEILEFADGSTGLVFYLGKDRIGTILLQQTVHLTAGTYAYSSGLQLSVPTGDQLLGRVVDPLGRALDGEEAPDCKNRRKLDTLAPPITSRTLVNEPLYTGTKIIDGVIPIGKGQRQLIIGDTGLGKSSLCLDAIINQKDRDVLCIYVMIGQKRSFVVQAIEALRKSGALAHTVVVLAEATALPGLQYLAPFAGCAIAEEWMWQGRDTLVVYDDLTTHARTYRELSLLLRRPPGREAYPGDIFYLHSRLLERSTHLDAAYGGGSMTALPIIETDEGEIASYIPTNLISITDGQIYLDRKLFTAGFLPAIDITRSVSRIGSKAQHERIKQEVGRMKLDYLQFLELEIFTRFGSKLEASIEAKIRRGRLVRELLKQERMNPISIEVQMAILIALNDGLLDGLNLTSIQSQLNAMQRVVDCNQLSLEMDRSYWSRALEQFSKGVSENANAP